jgi:hypothetical protein
MLVYLLAMMLIFPIGLPLGALIKLWQLKPHLNLLGEVEKTRGIVKKKSLRERHEDRQSRKKAKVSLFEELDVSQCCALLLLSVFSARV